jgi:hypothetical protein
MPVGDFEDSEIKTFVKKTLPTLKEHLRKVEAALARVSNEALFIRTAHN